MRQDHGKRERCVHELSKKNRWYRYELRKKHLSLLMRETEVKRLTKSLKV